MHWIINIFSLALFIVLLVLGVQAVISLTWSFGWLFIALIVGLALFDVIDIGGAITAIIFIGIVVLILQMVL